MTTPAMSLREMNLRIFRGEPIPHVLFQPRFEPWFAWHQQFGHLSPRYREMTILDLVDDLGTSMRYMHYYTPMPSPVVTEYVPEVAVRRVQGETESSTIYSTPHGDLVETFHLTVDGTWRRVGFAVRMPDDLRALTWLAHRTRHLFSAEAFAAGSAYVGERGEPQFWVPKSPYQALAQIWMRLPDLIYALADTPNLVEEAMQAIDASYEELYAAICASGQVRIVNFGENIHQALFNPRYLERYLIPWWEARAGQLHRAGIFSHVHLDGYFHNLLPYLRHLPFDGLEALTPTPQGDVELEEMAEHTGDKVLLDGIPAVLFTTTYSREELMATTERIVRLFSPRLILGISDELPEGAGEDGIERVRMVAEWCRAQRA